MFRLAVITFALCCLASSLALADGPGTNPGGPSISGFTVTPGPDDYYVIGGTVVGSDPATTSVVITGAAGNHVVQVRPDGTFVITVQVAPGTSGLVSGTAVTGDGTTGPTAIDFIDP